MTIIGMQNINIIVGKKGFFFTLIISCYLCMYFCVFLLSASISKLIQGSTMMGCMLQYHIHQVSTTDDSVDESYIFAGKF